MQQFSSSSAKQGFGALLKASALGPVVIEKHRKQQAVLASPIYFQHLSEQAAAGVLDGRKLARAEQALVEQNRLLRHHRIALDLLTLPARPRQRLIAQARAEIQRWQDQHLCHAEYARRWSAILALPAREMAQAMTSDQDGWGNALRQNSPFVGLHA